ncbi:MAG: glycosyltransferase family 4 protein, partial [Desulfovibrio sp.]|nr:glycosyltransferase family 4 protein [Desulfovibrio sp.]
MKKLAIDCRMAQMSGIGVYIRNIVPLCMALMPDVSFKLLGYDDSFTLPDTCQWEKAAFDATIYSIAEQAYILPLLRSCDALWMPHYPVPVLSTLPLVVTVHDVAHLALADLYRGVKKNYTRLMFQVVRRKAKEILFVSEFTHQEFLRRVGQAKGATTVVHNGVGNEWLEPPFCEAEMPPYFVAVGNIKPHKNPELLCRAFLRIVDRRETKLVFVGQQEGFLTGDHSLKEAVAMGNGRIRFAGMLDQQQLISLVRGSQALVFPSRYEGFGLPPLEAMAAGVPVIASDI